MREPQPIRSRRRQNTPLRDGRSWRGGMTGFGLIAACFAIAYFAAPDWVADHNPFARPVVGQSGPSLAEAHSGAIFIASMNQDTCRQRTFDNESGLQWDIGVVDCRLAILRSRGQNPVSDRMNAITDTFRPK